MSAPATEYLTVSEIARHEREPYKTVQKRLNRSHAIFINDTDDARRRLYPLSVLSPAARERYWKEKAVVMPETVLPITSIVLSPKKSLQPLLPFVAPSRSEEASAAAVAAIPKAEQLYVDKWIGILGCNLNGTWKDYQGKIYGGYMIRNGDDFIRARAHLEKVSVSSIYEKLRIAREIIKNADVAKDRKWAVVAESLRPKCRPGRSSVAFFTQEENAWMLPELRTIYLNQAQFSKEQAYRLLIDLIDRKQRAWGLGHFYHKPTKWQVFTALEKISKPEEALGRQGEKSFNDRFGMYISRDADTLRTNDLWVTDQKQVDVRLRDGGERLGRIWMVNFLDVATDRVLGFAFGPILSSDMVMMAACMAIESFGVPHAIHMDLGKEFICKAFNGSTRKFSGEVLYREAQGLWKSLNVQIVKAIGRNPQSKTIERWHANLPDFDRRFPGYCGSSPDDRPGKLVMEESDHLAWLAGAKDSTPLVKVGQYIKAYYHWVENVWNGGARGRGKMRKGMTPNEAWNVKRPAEGFRTVSLDELDHHSADHRFVKIARGGQVNLTFFGQTIEYEHADLFLHQGEECEVIVSRRTFRQVTVIYPVLGGTASCVATLKPQLAWLPENRDELRAAMRCKAAVHRAIRQGVKASKIALEAANPVALLEQQKALPAKDIIGTQKFFSEPPLGNPETGRAKRRNRTASDLADRWMQEEK